MVQSKGPIVFLLFACVAYYLWHEPPISDETYKAQLSGKVVLLCGSSSGIGEELAYNLASFGAKLILVSRTESKLQAVKKNAEAKGSPGVEIIPFDLSDTAKAPELISKAVAVFGGIDHVVLNHAALPTGPFLSMKNFQDPEFIEKTFRTNFFSHIQLTLAVLPHIEEKSGHVIITSSMAGELPFFFTGLYASSKHALNGFFYSLQQELLARKSKVTVTVAALGAIMTNEVDLLLKDKVPDIVKGGLAECVQSMTRSFVTRQRTVTFPRFTGFIGRLAGQTPFFHEIMLADPKSHENMLEYAKHQAELSKTTGYQSGNLGIDEPTPAPAIQEDPKIGE